MSKEKILLVLSHPDDETIFGWPAFFDDEYERELLVCSTDFGNPKRQWCAHRKHSTIRLCANYGVKFDCFDYPSEFYRLPTRDGQLDDFYMQIANRVQHTDADIVFTHNPHGEYGHLDHKLVFDIVFNYSPAPIWYTDICQRSNWPSDIAIKNLEKQLFYKRKVGDYTADDEKLDYCEKEYRAEKVWTWDKSIVRECGVYEI